MEEPDSFSLRDVQHAFKAEGPWPVERPALRSDSGTLRAKTFKSGNSMALRLPAALGLKAGVEMELTVIADGTYHLKPMDAPRRKIDVSKFAGKAPWLKELPRYDFEDSPRDWHLLDGADAQS
jgi:antitoxin VapB